MNEENIEIMKEKAEQNSEYGKPVLFGVYGKIVTSCDICGNTLNEGGDEFNIIVNGKNYTICPDCAIKYTLFNLYENGIIPDIAREYHESDLSADDVVCAESDSADEFNVN